MENNLFLTGEMKTRIQQLQHQLGYHFKKLHLLHLALTHKSYIYENNLQTENDHSQFNERMEFLGDSVLQVFITHYLYTQFPFESEGTLSKKRSSLVNEGKLFEIAKTLQLTDVVQVGKGEKKGMGHTKSRLLSSTVEAIMGACFLDGGLEVANQVIRNLYQPHFEGVEGVESYNKDYKTQFQEVVQKQFKQTPVYEFMSDEMGTFTIEVKVLGQTVGRGSGQSKKQAEQNAAFEILEKLKSINLKQIMDGSV